MLEKDITSGCLTASNQRSQATSIESGINGISGDCTSLCHSISCTFEKQHFKNAPSECLINCSVVFFCRERLLLYFGRFFRANIIIRRVCRQIKRKNRNRASVFAFIDALVPSVLSVMFLFCTLTRLDKKPKELRQGIFNRSFLVCFDSPNRHSFNVFPKMSIWRLGKNDFEHSGAFTIILSH